MTFLSFRKPGSDAQWQTNGPLVWINTANVLYFLKTANGGTRFYMVGGDSVEVMEEPESVRRMDLP